MKGKKTKAKVAKSFHVDPSLPMKVVLSLFKPQREGTLEIEVTHTKVPNLAGLWVFFFIIIFLYGSFVFVR